MASHLKSIRNGAPHRVQGSGFIKWRFPLQVKKAVAAAGRPITVRTPPNSPPIASQTAPPKCDGFPHHRARPANSPTNFPTNRPNLCPPNLISKNYAIGTNTVRAPPIENHQLPPPTPSETRHTLVYGLWFMVRVKCVEGLGNPITVRAPPIALPI